MAENKWMVLCTTLSNLWSQVSPAEQGWMSVTVLPRGSPPSTSPRLTYWPYLTLLSFRLRTIIDKKASLKNCNFHKILYKFEANAAKCFQWNAKITGALCLLNCLVRAYKAESFVHQANIWHTSALPFWQEPASMSHLELKTFVWHPNTLLFFQLQHSWKAEEYILKWI